MDAKGELDVLFNTVAAHFAGRRDALNAIAQLGNRFEDWLKWEVLIAIHNALLIEPKPWFSCVGVERSEAEADMFIGAEKWAFEPSARRYDWPNACERDVWLELKARTTRDKGGAEVAACLKTDLAKLKKKVRIGRGVGAALLLQYPDPDVQNVQQMADDAEQVLGKASFRCAINDHSLNSASHPHDTRLPVKPTPLAVVIAWEA